jgi:hypothetical protein
MTASKSVKDGVTTKKKSPTEQAAEALAKLSSALTDEQRRELEQLGFVVPEGDISSALRGEYSLGYRCPYCNEVALYFVGDSWPGGADIELKNGTFANVPPLHVSIDKIAWTQKGLSAGEIDRHNPACQNCSTRVVLGPMRRLKHDLIVQAKWFKENRDRSYDRKLAMEAVREHGGAEAVGGLPSNYNDPRSNPSEFMSDQDKADVTHLSERYDPLSVVRKE